MLRLILTFVDIALHRRGPDQLPSSQFFFAAALAISWSLEAGGLFAAGVVAHPILLAIVHSAVDLLFIWVVLKAFGRERRFRQTASAMLGIDIAFLLITMLLIGWHKALAVPSTEPSVPSALILMLQVWSVDITGFVLSRAVDRPYLMCVAMVIGYVVLYATVRQWLFPVPVPAA